MYFKIIVSSNFEKFLNILFVFLIFKHFVILWASIFDLIKIKLSMIVFMRYKFFLIEKLLTFIFCLIFSLSFLLVIFFYI